MICDLCKREVETLTRHHLKPKARGGSKGDTISVCLSCKDMIHQLIPNKQLDREYNTLEKLLENPRVKTYVDWIKNKNKERMTIARKKRRL